MSDSVAAFLAAGVEQAGEAVSSLGSTLAIDLLSTRPIDAAKYGICSYRWNNQWIVGEMSRSGTCFPAWAIQSFYMRLACNTPVTYLVHACSVKAGSVHHAECCLPPDGNVAAADGGSNTGGAVLKQFFSTEQLQTLSKQIEPSVSSGSSSVCQKYNSPANEC